MDTNENCYYFLPDAEVRRTQRRFVHSARRTLLHVVETLVRWSERASQRRRLRELDWHMLKDIGFSAADVERESSKWFWQD
jgi:uncharacterized protein YjiS (DUF1127 family)